MSLWNRSQMEIFPLNKFCDCDKDPDWGCSSWKKRMFWGHLILAFQWGWGAYESEAEGLFIQADSDRTRGNHFKV